MRGSVLRTILAAAFTTTAFSVPAIPADSAVDAIASNRHDVGGDDRVVHGERATGPERARARRAPAPLHTMLAELAPWRRAGKLLGSREQRKLAAASARLELQSRFLRNPESDPYYDQTRSQVRGGYLKLYREMLRENFVDDWIDDAFESRSRARPRSEGGVDGRSRHLKVVPRLALGSHGSIGAKLSLPDVGVEPLEHLSLGVRHGYGGDEWGMSLRYSAGPRFLQLERADGGRDGKRYAATLVFRF